MPPSSRPCWRRVTLLALGGPVLETLGLTFEAMLIAFAVSLPLGVMAGLRLPGSRALLAGLGVVRSIPDLTLAILCVILFGVGPGAGLVALAIYYSAAASKMFATS